MDLLKEFRKKYLKNKSNDNRYFIIIERLKPWIVINCLKKENYLITDNIAEEIAITIVKQAMSLNVLDKVIKKVWDL